MNDFYKELFMTYTDQSILAKGVNKNKKKIYGFGCLYILMRNFENLFSFTETVMRLNTKSI